jgi:hypothetical protein
MADDETVSLSFGQELGEFSGEWGLPGGYEPIFAIHANLQNAQPLIEMALASSQEDMGEVRPMLEQAGVLGEGAMVFDMAVGSNGSEALTRGTFHGLREHAEAMGIPRDVTLDSGFLSLIPGDATYVTAGVFDLGFMKQMMQMPEVQQGLAQVNEELGIDLEADVINQIGQRGLLYQSDRTGGGGILSTIVVLELVDGAQFGRAHRRLVDAANDAAAETVAGMTQGFGGVEIKSRRSDGVEFFTLTFPGLPIPAEISWTIHGDHLMLALSPRSLVEAMSQAGGNGESFADNDMLEEMTGRAGAELVSVQYTDAPRFARQGYWLVSTLCAGASNALRTTEGPDPGIPLPAFNDFIEGIEPTMMVSYWDGDDMKISGRSDASVLVSLAGSSGAILGPLAIAAAAGAVLPAMGEAREAARQVQSAAQLRQFGMAINMYAADHNDRLPESIDDLMPYLGNQEMPASPLGPASDGGSDYAIRSDLGGDSIQSVAYTAQTFAAIDRAAVVNGEEQVAVVFMDGHVEQLFTWQLTDMLAEEYNRGAFEAFGLPDWLNPGF